MATVRKSVGGPPSRVLRTRSVAYDGPPRRFVTGGAFKEMSRKKKTIEKNGIPLDFPRLKKMPTFWKEPLPVPFRRELWQFGSSLPTDLRLSRQPPLPDFDVPLIAVSAHIRYVLLPTIFLHASNILPEDFLGSEVDITSDHTVSISIQNTAFNRLVLTHALYGFTFQTSPIALFALPEPNDNLPRRPAGHSALTHEDDNMDVPLNGAFVNKDNNTNTSQKSMTWDEKASSLYRHIVSLNLQAISNVLNSPSVWTFTLHVEPSPYFGQGGVNVHVCFHSLDGRLHFAHLQGIQYAPEDIPNLIQILKTICPTFSRKLLGIVAELSTVEHHGLQGALVSKLIACFGRLVPRKPKFIAPDDLINKRPPLLPCEIMKYPNEDMVLLVERYRSRLEFVCGKDQVEIILNAHKELKKKIMVDDDAASCDDVNWDAFEKSWAPFSKEFESLFRFFGGLATAYLSSNEERTNVSISCLTGAGIDERQSHISAEMILQMRQFMKLRTLLLYDSARTD